MDDELTIIEQAKIDPDAFLELYQRYVDRIYAFAFRRTYDEALAKDITSATFEKALRSIQRYQPRGIAFSAWLYRIARHEIADHYRRYFLFVPLPGNYSVMTDPEQAVQTNQERSNLQTALARLSSADRELITLRYLDELSSQEVADILGCSTQTVYLRLHRALGRLRKQLERIEASQVTYAHK